MTVSEICRVRAMVAGDLEMVLSWRNHPEVRRFMLTQHVITLEEHMNWFGKASKDRSRSLLIAELDQVPIGFIQFTDVAEGGAADWSFHAAPGAAKGSGTKLGSAALDYAFGELSLHKVCGQALEFNKGSIALHQRLGFRQEGVLREQYRIDGAYHSLVCFGLLQDEWAQVVHKRTAD